jgi:hypothetical protein
VVEIYDYDAAGGLLRDDQIAVLSTGSRGLATGSTDYVRDSRA